jgi:16S rRNA (cytosine1407-C5)-methyltransferase
MNVINAGVLHYKGEILSKIYDNYFDKILVDVPCSGLGIIQKKEEVSNWWSKDRVKALSELQLKLLIAAIKMLKPGGELVYSTCTLTPEENEMIINSAIKKYPVKLAELNLPLTAHNGLTSYNNIEFSSELLSTKRLIPWEVNSDGFFLAKMIKTDTTLPMEKFETLRQKEIQILDFRKKILNKSLNCLCDYFGMDVNILSGYKFILKGNDLYFLNHDWNDDNPGLFERIGTRFGLIDRNGTIIIHTQSAQVLQNSFTKNVYYITEADELKKYLDGGIFKNKSDITGQCAVSFNGYILGSAVVTSAGVKSRFPRAKRTQDIYKEF